MRYKLLYISLIIGHFSLLQWCHAQSIISLTTCDTTYIDPQDANANNSESRDTLIYSTTFPKDNLLREFYVDINAFGGRQVDRANVFATLEDGSQKSLGEIAFGNCLSCVEGFAFVHNGSLQTMDEDDPSVMELWLRSFGQPDFSIIGNLQSLNGVGRISGNIPFCAVGLQVVFEVNSNPNNATTEFTTRIVCPREIKSCAISKEAIIDCVEDKLLLKASIPMDCFPPSARLEWRKEGLTVSNAAEFETTLNGNEGWYQFLIEDDCCILVDSILVENPDFADAGPDLGICLGEAIEISGSGGRSHFWEKEDGTVFMDSLVSIVEATVESQGNYVLHAFNEEGCEDLDTLFLNVNIPPAPQLAFSEACVGDTLLLQVLNGGQFSTIEWFNPNGIGMDSSIFNLQLSDFGTYTARGTDVLGCTAENTIEVSGSEPPAFAYEIEESCDSTRALLYPESYQFDWSTGFRGNEFSTATGGEFQITITDAEGCSSVEPLILPIPDGPEIDLEVVQPLCPDDNGAIRIVPKREDQPMIFSLDGGETFGFETNFTGLGPGTYQVVVQDDLDCIQNFEVELIRPDTLWVELEIDSNALVVRPGTALELSAVSVGNIEEIQWLPLEINTATLETSFVANNDMDIRVIVKDANGCFVSDALQLSVELGNVYSPNAFSPNQDGNNEFFTLYSDLGSGEIIELLEIYDRYGSLLFRAKEISLNQPALGWDGTANGELMTTGLYAFLGIVRFGNGERKIYEGDVQLLR